MKTNYLFLLLLLLCIPQLTFAQNEEGLYPMGVLDVEDSYYDEIPQKTVLTRSYYGSMPSAFSLKKYAPYTGNQGYYGTCTGWAVAYTARTILEAQRYGWTDRQQITERAFSPTFQFRVAPPNGPKCGGAITSYVVKSLQTVGSLPITEFKTGDPMCPAMPLQDSNKYHATKHKIQEFATLWRGDYNNSTGKIERTKASLAQGNPVIIGMKCPKSFHKVGTKELWEPTESPNEDVSGLLHGRHALCVVGYDDNKYGGAFEIQNSWGIKWGNQGYVWVRYSDFADFTIQAYELIHLGKIDPNKPYLAGSLRLFHLGKQKDIAVTLDKPQRDWISGKKTDYTYKTDALVSGTQIRLYLENKQAAFVYILGYGSVSKRITKLFPIDGMSAALNYTNSEVALPSDEDWIEMDATVGKDYLMVIYSKKKLNIDAIQQHMENNSKSKLSQRLKAALGDRIILAEHISYSKDAIQFNIPSTANISGKTAFAMIIESEHKAR